MGILSKICALYPVEEYYLMGSGASYTLARDLSLSEADWRGILEKVERVQGLVRDNAPAQFRIAKNANGQLLCSGEGRDYVFSEPGRGGEADLLWTLYALSCGKALPNRVRISARVLSAAQQSLAGALLAAKDSWFRGWTEEERQEIATIVKKILAEGTELLLRDLPRFSERPVTEQGWEMIRPRLRTAKASVRLDEFAEQLFGDGSFADTLERFCQWRSGWNDFQRTAEDAAKRIERTLFQYPLDGAQVVLRESMADTENSSTDLLEPAKESLRQAWSGKLDPACVASAFQDTDKKFTAYASSLIQQKLWHAVSERLNEKLSEYKKAAFSTRVEWEDELRPFFAAGRAANRLNLTWNQLNPSGLVAPWQDWTSERLSDIYMFGKWQSEPQTGSLWFANPDVVRESGESPMQHLLEPAHGLSRGVVVILNWEPLEEKKK